VWKKISANAVLLSLLSGLAAVLAFPPIKITGLLVFCPLFLFMAVDRCRSWKQAFFAGFITSLVIMTGGFYWVVYTLHVFGYMPWAVAAGVYLVFCGLGSLNFPFFAATLHGILRKCPSLRSNALWYALGAPALFSIFEFAIPKLFPWYVGHAYFESPWLTQIIEFTGSEFLTFLIFCWGGVGAASLLRHAPQAAVHRAVLVPFLLTLGCVGFSAWRLSTPLPSGGVKRVALIQANIGSLDKVQARQGLYNKVQYTIEKYTELTDRTMKQDKKPDLILWPETAMPFGLGEDRGYAVFVRRAVTRWNIPLITGGYTPATEVPFGDYNAAFLLDPHADGITTSIYRKNILLAFGEYFPGGEQYPKLYEWFPQVSNFRIGRDQPTFTLRDGTRVGATICYEDIVPAFYRKITRQGVQMVVNLTNDSWFGPTSEPYQHAALASFRAIEARTPFVRVTNTGISFAVDRMGRLSQMSPVYDEAALTVDVDIPPEPVITVYTKYGDWLIGLLMAVVLGFVLRARNVPVRT
jgi:apolipoprotein N-acyltransferase